MNYIVDNIECTKKKIDIEVLRKKMFENSVQYLDSIEQHLKTSSDIQFRIYLTNEVSKLLDSCEKIKNLNLKNEEIKQIYLDSYHNTFNRLEIKYKPHIKEAFPHFSKLWKTEQNYRQNESLWKNFQNYYKPKAPQSKTLKDYKKSNWEYVFELILDGKIVYSEDVFYLNDVPYRNKTELGKNIANYLKVTADFRPIFSDSIGVGGSKDIFKPKNLNKIKSIMNQKENKMCSYFQDKLDKLKDKKPKN